MKKYVSICLLAVLMFTSCREKTDAQTNEGTPAGEQTETGGFRVEKIQATDLPSGIQFQGKIVDSYRWTDNEGEHLFFTTVTPVNVKNTGIYESELKDQSIYAFHYLMENGKPVLKWKILDYVKECEFEMILEYKKPSEITDLDEDGFAEVWVMYHSFCGSDVSPTTMKIVMYEQGVKHAIRGESKVTIALDEDEKPIYYGGTFSMDEAFSRAPEVIKSYATTMWKNNINGN